MGLFCHRSMCQLLAARVKLPARPIIAAVAAVAPNTAHVPAAGTVVVAAWAAVCAVSCNGTDDAERNKSGRITEMTAAAARSNLFNEAVAGLCDRRNGAWGDNACLSWRKGR